MFLPAYESLSTKAVSLQNRPTRGRENGTIVGPKVSDAAIRRAVRRMRAAAGSFITHAFKPLLRKRAEHGKEGTSLRIREVAQGD